MKMFLEKVKANPTREDLYEIPDEEIEITEEERQLVKQILLQELGNVDSLAFYATIYAYK
ncbi:MAG: hypothetical protein BAJALOKI1v1_460013 [Promethearchaeota archaeon]|nr:MAG: hypothetical protein BAJALOKI1v1_460013 [Candidatus Lokiarchaeota archaeon]